ncbi:MAG: diguanylate cyclase, partial [Azoarcus sp.]|nr:diguanylate cyclase [Azoarcus sp.]
MGKTSSNSPPAPKETAATPGPRKPLRPLVLLVDDESSNLRLLIEALRSDYEVAVANSGKAALQFLSDGERPAIILLDIMMPEMDGYEVCYRIKNNPDTRSIPIIFVTALTDIASEEHGFELGAVDYIHKPLKLALVRARVRTHMTMRGMLDQLLNTNTDLNEQIADLDRTNRALDKTATELQFARSRQELFARIFASSAEGIIVANADGKIEAVNRAFIRITGYPSDEAVGQDHYFLKSGLHAAGFYREISQRLHDSGHWSGEMLDRRKNGEVYPELRTISAVYDDDGSVSHYVSVFSDISGIKQTQERIDFLTWHDSLTELPNRMLYLDRVDLALRSCRSRATHTAAMVLDIDGFKSINDAQGLQTGDCVLCETGRRIARVLRSDDTVARLAADEFAILLFPRQQSLPDVTTHALEIAEALRHALAQPLECGGQTFHLACSIGIHVFPANTDETPLQVLQSADTARHRATLDGGNRAVFFEESMAQQARQHFELAQALQLAVEHDQLRLYLQPQVNGDGVVVSAESLVRWEHPQRGLILPAEFIQVAEESRLIIELDRWMLRHTCELIAEMQRTGCPLRISVNISPRHFTEASFVDDIRSLLERSAIDPTLLMLE